MTADVEEFNVEMQKQKERARNAAAIETGDWITLKEGETEFVGYDVFECDAEILRYRKIKQKNKELFQVVLDKTPFYAEMGGQVGDSGWLIADDETVEVIDTKRENNLPIHLLAKLPKDVTVTFTARINGKKRLQCEANHSATHLLHEALREVLGNHVDDIFFRRIPNHIVKSDTEHQSRIISFKILREIVGCIYSVSGLSSFRSELI